MKGAGIVLGLLFVVLLPAQAQFRRARQQPTQELSGNNLNYANPQEYYVGGLELTGLSVYDKGAILSLTGIKVGDKIKIPGEDISGAIRKLWKHGLFGDVSITVDRIEGQNAFLTITLSERPRLTDFYFSGINKSRETALKEDLKLIRGKIVNDAMIRNTELAVTRHFAKKGFLNTEVKILQEIDSANRGGIRMRIDVDLNSKVRIRHILVDGNAQVSDQAIRKKLKKTKEAPRMVLHRTLIGQVLGITPRKVREFFDSAYDVGPAGIREFVSRNVKLNFFTGSKLIRADLEEDKIKVVDYMNTKGFHDSDVLSDSVIHLGNGWIDLRLKVNEGPKYYFRNITWTGNTVHSDMTLSQILGISPGDVYNREAIEKKITFDPRGVDITGLYMDDGYLFFSVKPVETAVSGDSIDVEMRVTEGDPAIIDRVTVTGNERTSDHVILRELSTIPGQKFRRADLIRSQQQLSTMGYFNPEKVDQNIVPHPEQGKVDIEWKLEEQSNDQVELSGGWGGYYGFVGTVGLTFNNFSLRNVTNFKKWRPLPVGDGQRLALRLQANGRTFQSYSFSFTEPWLGGRKPNSFTVSFNSSTQRSSSTGFYVSSSSLDAYLKVSGFTFSLGRRLEWPDNYFTLTNSIALLRYELNNWNSGLGFSTGYSNSIAFNTTLARSNVDSPMFPTQGSTVSLSASLTPPYSLWSDLDYATATPEQKYKWVEYVKLMFDARYYLKVVGKLVAETRLHFGYITTYTTANRTKENPSGAGPFERFFLGGDGLAGGFNSFLLGQEVIGLRGYGNNLVTPPLYAAYTPNSNFDANVLNGGVVYNKFSLELRYPVTTGQQATIYGLVFAEGGNNWNNYEAVNPFTLYKAAGAGVRIFMPAFGLIGLNWGYGFDTLPNSNSKSGAQFHFTIGQQLR